MFGFAFTLAGFIFPFPTQMSFVLAIILSSFSLVLGLLVITLIEKKEKEDKYNGFRRGNR